jgi:hypothetical protein
MREVFNKISGGIIEGFVYPQGFKLIRFGSREARDEPV